MRSACRRIVVVASALAITAVAACVPLAERTVPSGTPRVTMSAGSLLLDGSEWWPVGFNAYQLATDWAINAGCGAEVDLDNYFSALPEGSLTRFNAFQSFAVDKSTGAISYEALDAVLRAAEAHDQLVIPVLAGQDGACDGELFKQHGWYASGWRDVPMPVLTVEHWARSLVSRWSGSPAIAAWELVGEPEPSVCIDYACAMENRRCPADSAQVLRRFFDEAGAFIAALDPDRLITAGYLGGDQCGTAGEDFLVPSSSRHVDVLQFHDYSIEDPTLLEGHRDSVESRVMQARVLGKPLLVAEIGVSAGSCRSVEERAALVEAEIRDYHRLGAAGALFWSFVPDPRTHQCTMDIGPRDPLWDMLGELS
ncbi:beta-mannosidase [Hoyosella sp. G463]|uniref:Beta-mannosidase n=2 Tax=Lolliginicoccus lacisalsi TaxID=2742202 RepID=A0A927PL93_9ACTN|nr:beta-mannosidase [Lolliginicoccus lacisalsi]MBD8505147.1 beta-mannosidase [Lolliginicoccus lacisalsi]